MVGLFIIFSLWNKSVKQDSSGLPCRIQKKPETYGERVDVLHKAIKTVNPEVKEFDQELVKRLISNFKVYKGTRMNVQFHSGIVMKEEVDH